MKLNEPCWAVVDGFGDAATFPSESYAIGWQDKLDAGGVSSRIVPVTIVPTAELERLRACERVLRESLKTIANEDYNDINGSFTASAAKIARDALEAALGSEAK